VEEKKGGAFFTFLVFNQVTSRHSGSYTCMASNSAARVNYTAQLLVKGQFIMIDSEGEKPMLQKKL
jgi:hypothetical protein